MRVKETRELRKRSGKSYKVTKKPRPAPRRRSEPLPWQSPKAAVEDKDAPARVAAIMESQCYLQADQDLAFLQSDAMRGVRLQLDFTKVEQGLVENDIKHTVVVFGSTRIPEPDAAVRRLETARRRLEESPADPKLQRAVLIAERILYRSRYYSVAQEFGAAIGGLREVRDGSYIALMTGGGPGIMEAANRGAFEAGAKSIGLNITLPHEQFPNPYQSPGLGFRFHYFALRKMHFLNRARALVAFPGGYGTMDELFETLTLVQTRKIAPLPVVLVGSEFWQKAVNFSYLADEGVIDPEDEELFAVVETAEQIIETIADWHIEAGEPLIDLTRRPE